MLSPQQKPGSEGKAGLGTSQTMPHLGLGPAMQSSWSAMGTLEAGCSPPSASTTFITGPQPSSAASSFCRDRALNRQVQELCSCPIPPIYRPVTLGSP